MPQYEYRCQDCGKDVTFFLTLAEKEKFKAKCPKCGGKVSQKFSAFFAKTSRKA